MERWTGTPEGTCNVLRMFQETHAISVRLSSTPQDVRGISTNHSEQIDADTKTGFDFESCFCLLKINL